MTPDQGHRRTNTAPIYFPLDQGEQAAHLDVNQLLPRDIYERLAELIQSSVPSKSGKTETETEFLAARGHRAIFIDGDRGTGKTTVVVNLAPYLESPEVKNKFHNLASDVHILKPIDPTQLEDCDDLFLNVIVAAVLSDSEVKKALERSPTKRQQLHEKLQALGDALQGRETQKENYGLDRLRAFMGSQALAYAVHEFFLASLSLLDKRLLVMPIDDVDTSLHKAFDYLEVVRRYLSSTAILPIVCGDFKLYRDVTQRDSYRRFSVSSRKADDDTDEVTAHLAVEYLRKVLPVQRRVQMPNIAQLLNDPRILLLPAGEKGPENRVSLPQFKLWLRALLEGPVNGHENSALTIPIPTVRALSQLVGSIQEQFPSLERILRHEEPSRPSADLLKRLLRTAIGSRVHTDATSHTISQSDESPITLNPNEPLVRGWEQALLGHFRFVPDAGHVCLVLLASRHWRDNPNQSVLATPLFTPQTADEAPDLRYMDRSARIQWSTDLDGRVPNPWLSQLPDKLVIPFATPEIGRAVRFSEQPNGTSLVDSQSFAPLLVNLVAHRNFYSRSHQASLLCTGRIIEILVTSLVRNITADDIERIMTESPFHSIAAIAKTKAITIFTEDEHELSEQDVEPPSSVGVDRASLINLADNINTWRETHSVAQLSLSPWLTYCAINKALNQAAFFNNPGVVGTTARRVSWSDAFDLALAAFNALWAAYASFEKGPIFGLPLVLSNINLTISGDFEKNNLYLQNVSQLVSNAVIKAAEGDQVLSATKLLATHPLRKLIKEVRDQHPRTGTSKNLTRLAKTTPRSNLLEALGLDQKTKQLRETSIINALKKLESGNSAQARKRGQKLLVDFGNHSELKRELGTLKKAIAKLNAS
uniref:antiviral RADAR system adenosine triphosphatase RdrA n=1 Tax=Alcaligenes faecalis TaxID=511 RepID=UPI003CFBEAFC